MKLGRLLLIALACVASCGDPEPVAPSPVITKQPANDHERMVALLAELADRARAEHPYFGVGRRDRLLHKLTDAGEAADWRTLLDAAQEHLHLGEERQAIALLQRAHDGLASGRLEGDVAAKVGVAFHLGTARLRLAETENCCADPNTERCILPIRGGGTHDDTEGAEHAVPCFEAVLALTPKDNYWHFAARWLLNLTHMTLGTWPERVPVAEVLAEQVYADDSGMPRFTSVSAAVGLDTNGTAGGVVVEDLDGDELLDVVVSDWGPYGRVHVFHNDGEGGFVETTADAGLTGMVGGLNMLAADYDSDGDIDVLVLRGAWCYEHGQWPCSLLQNHGDGTFEDVTSAAGLAQRRAPTQAAAWADHDLDGDLDLYIGGEYSDRMPAHGHLYENDGAGHFRDVTARAHVANDRYCKGCVFGDFDGDRYPDLFVSNLGGANRLYHNQRDGTYRDVAHKAGVTEPVNSFPTWFWDFDNDGNLDLFVTDYHVGIAHLASHAAGGPLRFDHARLFLGDGAGRFRDASDAAGLVMPAMPMGSNFGDLDNDGWLDCYLGTGDPQYSSLMPNVMLKNDGGRRFVDVTMSGGFGHLQKGHGIAFADFDHDGDQDVFAVMGGAYPGDAFRNVLFENPGVSGHWLTVRLVGTRSVRCAIGARLCVVVRTPAGERRIYRDVTTGGSFGSSPLRQTVGLGDAEAIVRVEVTWPRKGDGAIETFEGVAMDGAVRIVEGSGEAVPLALRAVPFRKG